jgi:hypothetical protein
VLRLPWEFTVRGAIDRAGRLASGRPAGRFRRSTPRASCPLCRVVAALRCLYARAVDDGLITEAGNPARRAGLALVFRRRVELGHRKSTSPSSGSAENKSSVDSSTIAA